jgi:hypothetical protein
VETLRGHGIDADSETIVIFCNLAEWDTEKRTMSHHSPYYASGDSRPGTAWQVDSPLLDPALLSVKEDRRASALSASARMAPATASVWTQQALSAPCRIDENGAYDVTESRKTLLPVGQ